MAVSLVTAYCMATTDCTPPRISCGATPAKLKEKSARPPAPVQHDGARGPALARERAGQPPIVDPVRAALGVREGQSPLAFPGVELAVPHEVHEVRRFWCVACGLLQLVESGVVQDGDRKSEASTGFLDSVEDVLIDHRLEVTVVGLADDDQDA